MAMTLTLPGVKADRRRPVPSYAPPVAPPQVPTPVPQPAPVEAQPQGLDPVAVARLVSKAMGVSVNPATAAKLIAMVSALGNPPPSGNEQS